MKKKYLLIILFISLFMFSSKVLAASDFCDATVNPGVMGAFKIGSIVIMIIKIVVPLILIITGMIDMAKAVIEDKQDSIKSNAVTFLKRSIIAGLVFFTPTVLLAIFNLVENFSSVKSDFEPCLNCLLDTSKCPEVSLITKG